MSYCLIVYEIKPLKSQRQLQIIQSEMIQWLYDPRNGFPRLDCVREKAMLSGASHVIADDRLIHLQQKLQSIANRFTVDCVLSMKTPTGETLITFQGEK